MATTRVQIEKMQKQIKRLKKENAQLRRTLRGKKPAPRNGERAARKEERALSDNERGIEILRRAGMIRELTPEEKQIAARWDALPEERKQEVIRTLKSIRFDPPLSESIIQDRG